MSSDFLRWIVLVSFGLFAGCSGNAIKTVPAKGTIKTAQGEVCGNALIVFHPAEKDRLNDPKPVATADANGTFVLRTFAMDDGAVPGEYGVTVVWPGEQGEKALSLSGEGNSTGPDRLRGKYGNPKQPLLKVTIPPSGDSNISLQVEGA
jgi:hypothetical protein